MRRNRRAEPISKWYKPRSSDIVWRRHVIVLIPRLTLPTFYGLSWIVLGVGSYLSGACTRYWMMLLLFVGMMPTVIWMLFHIEDWRDEMYILSKREGAIIYQSRHPFSFETGKRLQKQFIAFTTATLGIDKNREERLWSLKSFFYWLFGCGNVAVFGEGAKIALEMYDVFNPAQKKGVLDKWIKVER